MFGYLMKHSFDCLMLLLKGISILRDIWDQSWRNFMLIKTTYPDLLQGSDFFCFWHMIINAFKKVICDCFESDFVP